MNLSDENIQAIEALLRDIIRQELKPLAEYWKNLKSKQTFTTREVTEICRFPSERALHARWRRGTFPPPADLHSRPYRWNREVIEDWKKRNITHRNYLDQIWED